MADRTTRLLLAAVALGLWANVLGDWLRPLPAVAEPAPAAAVQDDDLIRNIERYLMHIYRGTCLNDRIC